MNKRIYLCLAHMSGKEQLYIKEAFDTNWVVPLGPNVNGFEKIWRNSWVKVNMWWLCLPVLPRYIWRYLPVA